MIYAVVNGVRVKATPNQRANCPFCGGIVTSVCGQFAIAHWRHLKSDNCDSWSEGETEWHLNWKSQFPEHFREVIMYNQLTGEKHIADIVTKNGAVIEFQNSPIKPEEIESRNDFYKNIIWVVNGSNVGMTKQYFFMQFGQRYNSQLADFKFWGKSRLFHKWISFKCNVFFDFDEPYLFWLQEFNLDKTGVVKLVKKEDFLKKYTQV